MQHTPDQRHGGAYDRGSADSYYRRPYNPHLFVGGTYMSDRIDWEHMTFREIAEYTRGYRENQQAGNHKDY